MHILSHTWNHTNKTLTFSLKEAWKRPFSPLIYFTSFREQNEAYINSSQWSTLVGLKPAYICMWIPLTTTVLRMPTTTTPEAIYINRVNHKTHHTIIRAAFVCVFVPYVLRGPLTDLRQTWWVYVGWPPICPWGVLFRKGQRLHGSTGHFRFPLYYMRQPHSTRCNGAFCFAVAKQQSLILHLFLQCISTLYVGAPRNCYWGVLFLKGQRDDGSTGRRVNRSNGSHLNRVCRWTSQLPWEVLFRKGQQVDGSTGQTAQRVDGSAGQTGRRVNRSLSLSLYYIW